MAKKSVTISNDFCPQTLFLYGTYTSEGKPNFGLFCWFSYCYDGGLAVMAAIGGEKLTRDRIRETKVFSANLVTEKLLPLADYLGNTEGYGGQKTALALAVEEGQVLHVPTLKESPVTFELEVVRSMETNGGEVFLCRIRNLLMDESLPDEKKSIEERIRAIAPVRTTCKTYFGWDGRSLGAWGGLKDGVLAE